MVREERKNLQRVERIRRSRKERGRRAMFVANTYKCKEGNNRPSSVNQIALVLYHDKAGNKCYTQDNTDTRENPSV